MASSRSILSRHAGTRIRNQPETRSPGHPTGSPGTCYQPLSFRFHKVGDGRVRSKPNTPMDHNLERSYLTLSAHTFHPGCLRTSRQVLTTCCTLSPPPGACPDRPKSTAIRRTRL